LSTKMGKGLQLYQASPGSQLQNAIAIPKRQWHC